jgi:HAE1 family hydrophobic/amphiphilic exporter-1
MVVVAIILLGAVSLGRLQLDLMPQMDLPYALAYVTYRGAGPEEIEALITKPLENALGTVGGLKQIFSMSSAGTSVVYIEFESGTDMNFATLQMRERIDMIKSMLPDEASSPMVLQLDMNQMPVLSYSITGTGKYDIIELNTIVKDRIQGRIERIDGVASVSVGGGRTREIAVNVHPERLRGYGVTVQQITQLLSMENLNMPVGIIKQGEMDLTVRTIGEFETIEDIRSLPIITPRGALINLSDVADVEETFAAQTSYSFVNGERAVGLSVSKQSGANTVNVADAVNAEIEKIQAEMPDLNIVISMDQSQFIKGTINAVAQSGIYGALLAVLVLYVFLRNWRSTFIVATSIPISLIATFMLMYFSGVTLNMISLGGLALGVGMLVDNAIVVIENIFRHRELGKSRSKAAYEGAKEVGMAVAASTLTTVAVFLPVVFVQGIVVQVFRDLALTVSISLLASLAVSLTWVPMLSSKMLRVEDFNHQRKRRFAGIIFGLWANALNKIDEVYSRLLKTATSRPILVSIITLVFFVATLALVPTVGMEFFGQADQGLISVNIAMPKGTLLEETLNTAEEVVAVINRLDGSREIENLFLSIGGGGIFSASSSDTASINIELVSKRDRRRTDVEIAEEIRNAMTNIAGAEISVTVQGGMMMAGGGGLELTIYGSDMEELERVANEVRDIVATVEGTREVKTSLDIGAPEAAIRINRSKASVFGISSAQVASTLNTAVSGTVSTRFKSGGTEIDIRVRQNPENINYITDIENIMIQAPTGATLSLSGIAEVTNRTGPVTISRENQERVLTVSASMFGTDTNAAAMEVMNKLGSYDFPEGYRYEFAGAQEQMMESFMSLGMALILAVLLVYMVMASQFESLLYPFIIILSIPVALTCGILGLVLLRIPLSIVGFVGLILLAGIVVNNGIVLIDYINQLMAEGMPVKEAITEGGRTRLRPILMTTITTVLGMMPLILSTGDGAEMQRPLAVVVNFGLVISTLVTLVYMPILYLQMNTVRSFLKRKLGIKDREKEVDDLDGAPVNSAAAVITVTEDNFNYGYIDV